MTWAHTIIMLKPCVTSSHLWTRCWRTGRSGRTSRCSGGWQLWRRVSPATWLLQMPDQQLLFRASLKEHFQQRSPSTNSTVAVFTVTVLWTPGRRFSPYSGLGLLSVLHSVATIHHINAFCRMFCGPSLRAASIYTKEGQLTEWNGWSLNHDIVIILHPWKPTFIYFFIFAHKTYVTYKCIAMHKDSRTTRHR